MGQELLVASLTPVRLRAVRLGTPHLLLDAEASFSVGTGVAQGPPPSAEVRGVEMVAFAGTDSGLETDTLTGNLALYGGNESISGGAGVSRSLLASIDGLLLVDERATGWVAAHYEHEEQLVEVGVSAFGTRTTSLPILAPERVDWTWGGGLSFAYILCHRLRFGFDAEFARSFYVRLDGQASQPLPEFGFRGIWTFSTLIGKRS
jgi:hypothetical protein